MRSWVGAFAAVWFACLGAADADEPTRTVLTSDMVVAPDGGSIQTVHSETRAGDDAGALMASRESLPYNAELQQLDIVEAHTLKKDGTIVPVDPASVFEQLSRDGGPFAIYADRRTKVILFPQFAAGDTAVFTARVTTPHALFPGQFFHGAVFPQSKGWIDVRETITAPKAMVLHIENHNVEFSKRAEGDNVVYSWHHEQSEPVPSAPVAVSGIDREPRYFVSTFKDYAELGRSYAALAEPKIAVTAKIKALADQITAGETAPRAQAGKIYAWVSRNIRYVAIELGRGSLEPHDVDAILASGYGDCKDHDVVLEALLKAKSIAAESILLNSGNAYTLTEAPGFVELNHVITYLPQFDVYLDSSFSMAPFGILPVSEYGKPAIRVSAGGARQFTMPVLPAGLASVHTQVQERLDPDGTVAGTATTTAAGPSSIFLRVEGLALQTIGAERAAQLELALRGFKGATGTVDIGSPMELGAAYSISTAISSPGWSPWLAGKATASLPGAAATISAEPAMGPLYLNIADSEPVPCASVHAVEDVSLALPEGTAPARLPADTQLQTDNVTFTAQWVFAGGTLSLHRDYTSKFDEAICDGYTRRQTAAVLKKIDASYRTQIALRRNGP